MGRRKKVSAGSEWDVCFHRFDVIWLRKIDVSGLNFLLGGVPPQNSVCFL